jgi:hypothetical protein
MPEIRVWGRWRLQDWNEYWRLGRVLGAAAELERVLDELGVGDIDVCPWLDHPPRVSNFGREIEVFAHGAPDAQAKICEAVTGLTALGAIPSPVSTETEFRERVAKHLLYQRQNFPPWDDKLPCLILSIDFDQGNGTCVRAARPEDWRMVDHYVDGICDDRRYVAAMILEPSAKGQALLQELSVRFDYWMGGSGFHGRPPVDAILDYRSVLARYGVDCNTSFHDHLAEGWYPIDIQTESDRERARELIATPLPDPLEGLLLNEDGKPPSRYRAYFYLAALTDN